MTPELKRSGMKKSGAAANPGRWNRSSMLRMTMVSASRKTIRSYSQRSKARSLVKLAPNRRNSSSSLRCGFGIGATSRISQPCAASRAVASHGTSGVAITTRGIAVRVSASERPSASRPGT